MKREMKKLQAKVEIEQIVYGWKVRSSLEPPRNGVSEAQGASLAEAFGGLGEQIGMMIDPPLPDAADSVQSGIIERIKEAAAQKGVSMGAFVDEMLQNYRPPLHKPE